MTNGIPSLAGAFARLDRAREHLDEIDGMERRGEFATIDLTLTGSGTTEDTTGWFDGDRLAIVAGEVITNLRFALDYLAWELCRLDGAPRQYERGWAFPLVQGHREFYEFVARNLEGLSVQHIARFEPWQPFNGHPLLEELHQRANVEKHRHLGPNAAAVQRDYVVEQEELTGLEAISFIPLEEGGPYRPVRETLEAMFGEVESLLSDFASEFDQA